MEKLKKHNLQRNTLSERQQEKGRDFNLTERKATRECIGFGYTQKKK